MKQPVEEARSGAISGIKTSQVEWKQLKTKDKTSNGRPKRRGGRRCGSSLRGGLRMLLVVVLFLRFSRVRMRLGEGAEAASGRVEELRLRKTVAVALGAIVLHLGAEVPVTKGQQAEVPH